MKTSTISLIVFAISLVGIIGMGVVSYFSAYNMANRLENSINAVWTDNQNVLAQYSNKVAEAAQIPAMQRDDLTQVVTAALEARYGDDGSQAMFQFIKEQNPNIDSAVYIQLQRIIEAGRSDFAHAQTRLIDQKRVYTTALGSLWTGTMMGVAGFPRINLDEFNIVTNAHTNAAFQSGTEEPLKIGN